MACDFSRTVSALSRKIIPQFACFVKMSGREKGRIKRQVPFDKKSILADNEISDNTPQKAGGMMRRRFLFVCLFCIVTILAGQPLTAQDEAASNCLPPNFLIGSELRVVGSVEAGGLPVRAKVGLKHEVIGFIPLDTRFGPEQYHYSECKDDRNWFSVDDVPINESGDVISGYVVVDDGYLYWLEANRLCPKTDTWLNFWDYQNIVAIYPGLETLVVATSAGSDLKHPVLLDHYEIDPYYGTMRPTEYPYSDIVTRELTDRIGITEYVFGEHSRSDFSLHISPDRKKILYFVPSTELDNCVHFCQWVEGFVADVDGSNPKSLGEIPTEAPITRIYWGTDGRIYFTHITEEAPVIFTIGICMEAGCTLEGNISDITAKYGVNVPSGSIPTTSPNGQYLAITPLYRSDDRDGWNGSSYIIDTKNGGVITLPDSGLSGVPIFWETDARILYFVNRDGVVDKRAYEPRFLEHDSWIETKLDFTLKTYDFYTESLYLPDNPDIYMDNWLSNWVLYDSPAREMILPVFGGLHCIFGPKG